MEGFVDFVDRPIELLHLVEGVETHGLIRPVAAIRLDVVVFVESDAVAKRLRSRERSASRFFSKPFSSAAE